MANDSKSGSRKINQNVDLAPGARNLTTTGNITAGAFYGDGSNLTGVTTASANDALITITAGGGLTGGGGFTVDQAADAIITVSHSDTSAQASVANTAFNVIQSITLDTYGHVTAIESQDIGTAGFYVKTTGETGTGVKIGLGSLTYQTLQFFAGTGLSVVRTDNEIQFSAPNAANWNTAYSWGNHATAGYLTSFNETDPVYTSERDSLLFNKMVHATLLFSNLSDYNKPSGYSTMIQPGSYQNPIGTHGYYHIIARRDAGGGYGALLQSYNGHEIYHGNTTESTSNINWYKIWTSGDFSSTNVSNWNIAYSWGNHAGLYLGVGAKAADSELLDGYNLDGNVSIATRIFNNKGQVHNTYTDFNTAMTPGPNYLQGGANGPTGTASQWYGFMLGLGSEYNTETGNANGYASQLYWNRQSIGGLPYLYARDLEAGTWGSWRKMGAGYADTAGSALVADSANTANYATNSGSTNSVAWGNISSIPSLWYQSGSWLADFASYSFVRENGVTMSGGSEFVILSNGGRGHVLIDGNYFAGEQGGFYSLNTSNQYTSQVGFSRDGNAFAAFNTTVSAVNDVRAPIFYDSDNTGYYASFDGTTRLNRLYIDQRNDNYNVGSLVGLNPVNDWQSLTNTDGQWTVAQYNAIGSYANTPANVYTYGAVMSWRTVNHSFQLYASHTGDLAYKTQWNNDNYSGWKSPVVYGFNGGSSSGKSIYGDAFYDSDNTAHYINPSGGSNIRNLYVGDPGDSWSDPGGWGTQVRFSNGPHVKFVLHARTPGIEAGMFVHTPSSVYIGSYTSHPVNMMVGGNSRLLIEDGRVYSHVYSEAAGSSRAPIFYDSNDTSYYVDPNGTSRLYLIDSPQGYISNSNPWGTAPSAYFPYGITTAGQTNWVYGHTYLGNAPSNGSGAEVASNGRIYVRSANTSGGHGYAGLFIDRNNAANNYAPFSFENEYGNHSWGLVARFHITNSVGDRPSIQFSHSANNTRWSIGYVYPDDDFRITQNHGYRPDGTGNSDGWGTERFRIDTSGNTFSNVSSRAPIFYDSNNTGYYTDPAGLSRMNRIDFDNLYYASDANYGLLGTNAYVDTLNSGYGSDPLELVYYRGTEVRIGDGGGTKPIKAGIYYDGNNTGYYVDPGSSSSLFYVSDYLNNPYITKRHSGSDFPNGTLVETDIPASSTYGNSFVLEATGKSYSGAPPFSFMAQGYLYNNTIINYSGIHLSLPAFSQMKIFELNGYLHFWWPRWGYWNSFQVSVRNADGNSVNRVKSITDSAEPTGSKKVTVNMAQVAVYDNEWSAGRSLYAATYYDSNDTGYYVDPAGTSTISNLHLGGYIHVSRNNTTGNGIILADDGDIVDLNDGYCAMRFSYGVRVHSANRGGGAVHTLHSNGTFTASGDVVAYSDARVKENIEPITNALEKTLNLKGVYYNRTDKDDKSRKVGVIAQEIIEVLPEVVTEDDQGMLGVSYGNITAVLIEAIKEQQKQIEELKAIVNGITK